MDQFETHTRPALVVIALQLFALISVATFIKANDAITVAGHSGAVHVAANH
jgi:hypothetical protein